MSILLWTGTVLGAVIGVIHAIHICREKVMANSPGGAVYAALWAVVLWTLFGAYLLVFWIVGTLGLALGWLRKPRRPAP